ncbi:MAG: hypothetical protein HRT88_12790 [Lentisphaeraceae bacterium]|nr:hypothetical protein [Lentisphaeraceae bacterium]
MLNTPEQVANALQEWGYETLISEKSVITKVGGADKPYTAVLYLDNGKLNVSCEIAKLGEFADEKLPMLAFNALSGNTRIDPFAFAIIDTTDDSSLEEAEDYLLILTDTVALGDLSASELEFTMNSLWDALEESTHILKDVIDSEITV